MLRRVFLVLGPVQAAVEMAAFLVVLMGSGWRPGEVPDLSALLAASGAAFSAVIVGQAANVAWGGYSHELPNWLYPSKSPA